MASVRWFGLAAALAVWCAQVEGQPTAGPYKDVRTPPDTPAAKRAIELIGLLEADDPAKTKAYIETNFHPTFRDQFPTDEHLGMCAMVRQNHGKPQLHGFRRYEPPRPDTEAVAIFRGEVTQAWRGLSVTVETEPPYRIAGLNFSPARPPSDLPPPEKLSQEQLITELKKYLDRLTQAEAFSGTVLIAKDGKVIHSSAHGPACRSFNTPNKLDTKFNLGSMNKMFTAVAIAQLVERGKLSFSDPISKFLSTDWLPREISDKVTIEHLITHTSGLGSYFSDTFMKSSRELFREINDYKPLVAEEKLQFEPGSRWGYSNTGFLLLGAIVEAVTRQNYHDYVRENVFKPAGMINTDCYPMDEAIENLAMGYSKTRGPDGRNVWKNNLFKHTIKGGPAGGGYSTVEDLLRFDQALRSGKLVSRDTTAKMWTAKPGSPDYGYGFGIYGAPGSRQVGHSGGFPGISANLAMFLDSGYTVAVLSNYDNGARTVSDWIEERLKQLH